MEPALRDVYSILAITVAISSVISFIVSSTMLNFSEWYSWHRRRIGAYLARQKVDVERNQAIGKIALFLGGLWFLSQLGKDNEGDL